MPFIEFDCKACGHKHMYTPSTGESKCLGDGPYRCNCKAPPPVDEQNPNWFQIQWNKLKNWNPFN